MWDNSVITDAGAALLARWAGGGRLDIMHAATGSGTVDETALRGLTALTDEKKKVDIVGYKAEGNGVCYNIRLYAAETGYIANQIGIFAQIDEEGPTLIAVYQDEHGIQVPSADEMPDYVYAFYATIQMNTEGSFQVSINQNTAITREDLEESLQTHTHSADRITGGMAGGKLTANSASAQKYAEAQMRDIVLLPSDPGEGTQVSWADGTVIHVYE